MDYILEMRNISKRFGEVEALRQVDFVVARNEVVGLVGDNGAGKSTLIKIVTGYHTQDSGEVYFNGKKLEGLSVAEARQLGIETVYQERALANLQTLWRNIFMGRELTTHLGFLDVKGMAQETEKLMVGSMGFTSAAVAPDAVVGTFSGGKNKAYLLCEPSTSMLNSSFWMSPQWVYLFQRQGNFWSSCRKSRKPASRAYSSITMCFTYIQWPIELWCWIEDWLRASF